MARRRRGGADVVNAFADDDNTNLSQALRSWMWGDVPVCIAVVGSRDSGKNLLLNALLWATFKCECNCSTARCSNEQSVEASNDITTAGDVVVDDLGFTVIKGPEKERRRNSELTLSIPGGMGSAFGAGDVRMTDSLQKSESAETSPTSEPFSDFTRRMADIETMAGAAVDVVHEEDGSDVSTHRGAADPEHQRIDSIEEMPFDFEDSINYLSEASVRDSLVAFAQTGVLTDTMALDRYPFILPQGSFADSMPRVITLRHAAVPSLSALFMSEEELRTTLWRLHESSADDLKPAERLFLEKQYRHCVMPNSLVMPGSGFVLHLGSTCAAELPLFEWVLEHLGTRREWRGRCTGSSSCVNAGSSTCSCCHASRRYIRDSLRELSTKFGYIIHEVTVWLPADCVRGRGRRVVLLDSDWPALRAKVIQERLKAGLAEETAASSDFNSKTGIQMASNALSGASLVFATVSAYGVDFPDSAQKNGELVDLLFQAGVLGRATMHTASDAHRDGCSVVFADMHHELNSAMVTRRAVVRTTAHASVMDHTVHMRLFQQTIATLLRPYRQMLETVYGRLGTRSHALEAVSIAVPHALMYEAIQLMQLQHSGTSLLSHLFESQHRTQIPTLLAMVYNATLFVCADPLRQFHRAWLDSSNTSGNRASFFSTPGFHLANFSNINSVQRLFDRLASRRSSKRSSSLPGPFERVAVEVTATIEEQKTLMQAAEAGVLGRAISNLQLNDRSAYNLALIWRSDVVRGILVEVEARLQQRLSTLLTESAHFVTVSGAQPHDMDLKSRLLKVLRYCKGSVDNVVRTRMRLAREIASFSVFLPVLADGELDDISPAIDDFSVLASRLSQVTQAVCQQLDAINAHTRSALASFAASADPEARLSTVLDGLVREHANLTKQQRQLAFRRQQEFQQQQSHNDSTQLWDLSLMVPNDDSSYGRKRSTSDRIWTEDTAILLSASVERLDYSAACPWRTDGLEEGRIETLLPRQSHPKVLSLSVWREMALAFFTHAHSESGSTLQRIRGSLSGALPQLNSNSFTRRYESQLQDLNLFPLPLAVTDDRNSLFRSLSVLVYGREDAHHLMRLLLLSEMLRHAPDFAPYARARTDIASPQSADIAGEHMASVATYVWSMAHDDGSHEEGDFVALIAFARIFRTDVLVLTPRLSRPIRVSATLTASRPQSRIETVPTVALAFHPHRQNKLTQNAATWLALSPINHDELREDETRTHHCPLQDVDVDAELRRMDDLQISDGLTSVSGSGSNITGDALGGSADPIPDDPGSRGSGRSATFNGASTKAGPSSKRTRTATESVGINASFSLRDSLSVIPTVGDASSQTQPTRSESEGGFVLSLRDMAVRSFAHTSWAFSKGMCNTLQLPEDITTQLLRGLSFWGSRGNDGSPLVPLPVDSLAPLICQSTLSLNLEGFRSLVDATFVQGLTHLHVNSLTSLCLRSCSISGDATASLSALLLANPGLVSVDLSCCFTAVGDAVLSRLSELKYLRVLNLSDCPLVTSEGVFAFIFRNAFDAVVGDDVFCPLETLGLRRCWRVTQAAFTFPRSGVVIPPRPMLRLLETLDIRGCAISDLGPVVSQAPYLVRARFTCKQPKASSSLPLDSHGSLAQLGVLREISFEQMSAVSPAILASLLSNSCGHLESLALSRCISDSSMLESSLRAVNDTTNVCFPKLVRLDLCDFGGLSTALFGSFYNQEGFGDSQLSEVLLRRCNRLDEQSLMSLSSAVRSLRRLDLSGVGAGVTDECVSAIAERHGMSLEALRLEGSLSLTDASVVALAQHCRVLADLSLRGCVGIHGFGLRRLASARLPLRVLSLEECDVGDEDLKPLLVSCRGTLEYLSVAYCEGVRADTIEALRGCLRLRFLDVNCCENLQAASLAHAISSCCWPVLGVLWAKSLRSWHSEIIIHPRLYDLRLSWCSNLTDAAVVGTARNCPSLEVVSVAYCQNLTTSSIAALGQCSSLRALNVRGCTNVAQTAIQMLRADRQLQALDDAESGLPEEVSL